MGDEKASDDIRVKLYALLVEQLHKYATLFWQFPIALLAANFLALDKFFSQPWVMLLVAGVDAVLVSALYRLVINQRVIIEACREAETALKATNYQAFIPQFGPRKKLPAPFLTVYTLVALVILLLLHSVARIFA